MDLKKIIEDHNVDTKELAKQLFPIHSFPNKALERIMLGQGTLGSDQIEKLAEFLKVPTGALFDPTWKAKFANNIHTFKKAEFTVNLDIETWQTTILQNNNLKVTKLIGSPNITLEEYFSQIDKILLTL